MTEPTEKQWGERNGVSLELLSRFTKPGTGHAEVYQMYNYRGDGTQTGDMRIKAEIGHDAYQHHHWDALACNGGVVVVVPRWKFAESRATLGPGLSAEYYWAMASLDDKAYDDPRQGIRPCTKREILDVVPETRALLDQLPGLEYMFVKFVRYNSTAKKFPQYKPAPDTVRYFRFAAGYGCVAIRKGAGR